MTQKTTDNLKCDGDLPCPDFSALVLGLSSAALSYMGLGKLAGLPETPKNMPLAKQNIDIIALLSDKTKGNLTPDETKLTQQVLSDLRMKFVEQNKT